MIDRQTSIFGPPSVDDPELSEGVRLLVEVYDPGRIYLFGSDARDDAGADSDYDFVVMVPDTPGREPAPLKSPGALRPGILRVSRIEVMRVGSVETVSTIAAARPAN